MGVPITINEKMVINARRHSVHADKYGPPLERMMFTYDGSESYLKHHLESITDGDQLIALLVGARAEIIAKGKEEIRQAPEEMKERKKTWQGLFEGYFKGYVDTLLAQINETLPKTDRLKMPSKARGKG